MYGSLTATLTVPLPLNLTLTSPVGVGDTIANVRNDAPYALSLPDGYTLIFAGSTLVLDGSAEIPANTSLALNIQPSLSIIPQNTSTIGTQRNASTGRLITLAPTIDQTLRVSAELRNKGVPLDLPGVAPQAQLFYGRVPAISNNLYQQIHGSQVYECSLDQGLGHTQDGYLFVLATSANRQRNVTSRLGYPIQGIWQSVTFSGA